MTTAIRRRRGTTTQHSTFTGLEGEVTVDTTKDTLVVHDGSTAGGHPLAKENNATLAGNVTLSGGTANGVLYLNGSKVATSGSALTFDGTNLVVGVNSASSSAIYVANGGLQSHNAAQPLIFGLNGSEQMRLTSTGLGIGTSSPSTRLTIGGYSSANQTPDIQITRSSSGTAIQTGPNITFGDGTTNNSTTLQVTQGRFGVWNYGAGVWNERMSIDASGNLGIGTSSPGYKLQVNGDSYFRGLAYFGVGAGCYIDGSTSTAGYKLYVWDNASSYVQRMTVDSSGNLGLGVTPSGWNTYKALQVTNASLWGAVNNAFVGANYYYASGSRYYIANGYATEYSQASGVHSWNIAASGTAGNAITFTQAMTLDASGNLGVGETSPALRLHVKSASAAIGYFETSDTGIGPYVIWRNGTTSIGDVGSGKGINGSGNATDFMIASRSTYPLLLGTGSTERARIDSSGNLLVGTTNTSSYAGDSLAYETSNGYLVLNHSSAKASGWEYIYFQHNANVIGSIDQNGTTGVSYNTTSDYRLKEDVQPMTGALAKVAALKPCTYKWKVDGSAGEGFIAHELAEVVPQAVTGSKDAVNEDGSIKPQGIDTSFLVATLTAAIQELKAEFDAYKATHP